MKQTINGFEFSYYEVLSEDYCNRIIDGERLVPVFDKWVWLHARNESKRFDTVCEAQQDAMKYARENRPLTIQELHDLRLASLAEKKYNDFLKSPYLTGR